MNEEKRHVGRPTNEEVKIRKKKKLLRILIPIIFIIIFSTVILLSGISSKMFKLKGAVLQDSSVDINYPITFKNSPSFKVNFSRIGSRVKKIEVQFFADDSFNTKSDYYFGNGVCRPKAGSNSCALTVFDLKPKLAVSNYMHVKVITYSTSNGGSNEVLWRGYYEVYSSEFSMSKNNKNAKFTLYNNINSSYTSLGKQGVTTKSTTKKTVKSGGSSNSNATGLTINCPSSAKVNQQFTCTTNMAGAKISVTPKNLASGYNTSFTTTTEDKTKQSKYTKAGVIHVMVSKSGYKSVSTNVNITN